jgi:hypothetical protein
VDPTIWRGQNWLHREHTFKNTPQAVDVGIPASIAQLHGLPSGKRLQVARKVLRRGHRGSLDEHGDHANAAGKGGSDLETDEIMGIFESSTSMPVGTGKPLAANHSEQHVARAYCPLDGFHEVDTGFDVGNVHEDRFGAEVRTQVIEEPTRVAGAILTPVTDKDLGRDDILLKENAGGA